MREEPTPEFEEGTLAANSGGNVATSAVPETVKALREELERERWQRLEDVQRERKERLEAQRRAKQLELELWEAHRKAERLEFALWEAQREARRLRGELEAERDKGFSSRGGSV